MYNKLLVARHYPENKCFAEEGEVLTVIPKKPHPEKDIRYYFLGSKSKKKSQYGWVAEVEPFSIDDFVKRHDISPLDENEVEYIKIMLDSVQKQKPKTPMGASFAYRGIGEKRIVLTVHKVFFY